MFPRWLLLKGCCGRILRFRFEGTVKKVVGAFLLFKGIRAIGGLSEMVSGLTGLSKIKLAGGLMALIAGLLVIQDIATYMKYGTKGSSTWTGAFIEWLDKVGEKTHWVKDLADSLKTLFGVFSNEDIKKMDTGNLVDVAASQAGKAAGGFSVNNAGKWLQARRAANIDLRKLVALTESKKCNLIKDAGQFLDLGLTPSQQGNTEVINRLIIDLKKEGITKEVIQQVLTNEGFKGKVTID